MSCREMGCEGHAVVSSVLPWMISTGNGTFGPMGLLCNFAKACCNAWLSWKALDMAYFAVHMYLLMNPLFWGYRGLLVLWVMSCCGQHCLNS